MSAPDDLDRRRHHRQPRHTSHWGKPDDLTPHPGDVDRCDKCQSAARHDPTFMSARRLGAWATCSCGWRSGQYVGVTGAHLAFGKHLADQDGAA